MRFSTAIFLLWVVLAGCSGNERGESFPIMLDRPSAVGDAFRVVSAGTVSSSTEGGGVPSKTEKYVWRLEGVLEVVETDADGMPRRLSLTVEKLASEAKGGGELAPAGSQYSLVLNKGVLQFAFDETFPPDEVQMAVTTLLTVGEPGLDLEALFGGAPRRIGEEWAADVDRFVKARRAEGADVDVSTGAVEGRAVLAGRTEIDGVECLEIEMSVKMTGDMGESEWTFTDAATTIEIEIKVPVDPSLPILEAAHESEMEMVSPAPTGRGGDLRMTSEKSVTTKVEIIPPAPAG